MQSGLTSKERQRKETGGGVSNRFNERTFANVALVSDAPQKAVAVHAIRRRVECVNLEIVGSKPPRNRATPLNFVST